MNSLDPDQNRQSIGPETPGVDRNLCLLITFANSLDPDQNRQSIGPDVDRNHLSSDNLKFANSLDPDQNRQIIGPDVAQNHLSADNLCKQFGFRSKPTEHWS